MPEFREFQRILDGEHVIEEANGYISREQVLFLRGDKLVPGLVMGLVTEGAVTVTPANGAGMVGNSVFAAPPTADPATNDGVYRGTFLDADTIQLTGPNGYEAQAALGVAFDGPINFTRNAGITPHEVGDFWTVTVAHAARNLWAPLDLAGNDGRERARGVLFAGRRALLDADTRRGVVHVRHCTLNGKKITWPAGISEGNRKIQEAYLAEEACLIRY